MSGKINAIITRKYQKGRDWYDLLWYCSQLPAIKPDIDFLQNVLDQYKKVGVFSAKEWKQIVVDCLKKTDTKTLIADVQPFLERPKDAMLLNRESLLSVLETV